MSKFNRIGGKKIHDPRFKKKIITFGPNSGRFLTGRKEDGTIRDPARNDPQAIVKVRSDKNEILATYSLSAVEKTYGLSRKKLSEVLNTEGRYILDTNMHLQRKKDLSETEQSEPKQLSPQAFMNAEKHRIAALNRSGAKRYDFPANERPRALHYVRYADDFLIGINGLRSLAIEVKKEVSAFIGSDLHFKCSTAELHHARSD